MKKSIVVLLLCLLFILTGCFRIALPRFWDLEESALGGNSAEMTPGPTISADIPSPIPTPTPTSKPTPKPTREIVDYDYPELPAAKLSNYNLELVDCTGADFQIPDSWQLSYKTTGEEHFIAHVEQKKSEYNYIKLYCDGPYDGLVDEEMIEKLGEKEGRSEEGDILYNNGLYLIENEAVFLVDAEYMIQLEKGQKRGAFSLYFKRFGSLYSLYCNYEGTKNREDVLEVAKVIVQTIKIGEEQDIVYE